MLTGKVDPDAVKQAVQGGVSGYIAKPVSRAQIEVKLRIVGRKMLADQGVAT
jgi:AmiR/NasT family two-component response regulator